MRKLLLLALISCAHKAQNTASTDDTGDMDMMMPAPSGPTGVTGSSGTLALVESAFAAGTIDRSTALTYLFYAAYDPDKLPAAFAGPRVSPDQATLMGVIGSNWDTLTADAKAIMLPYLTQPGEVGTHWNLTGPSREMNPDYKFIDDPYHPIRYWYAESHKVNNVPMHDVVTARMKALGDLAVWYHAKRILLGREPCSDGTHGGSAALDFFFVNESGDEVGTTAQAGADPGAGAQAYIVPQYRQAGCAGSPAFLMVRETASTSQMVHELFHAFQFSFPFSTSMEKLQITGTNWFVEATAEYFSDFITASSSERLTAPNGYWNSATASRKDPPQAGAYVGELDHFGNADNGHYSTYIYWQSFVSVSGHDATDIGHIFETLTSHTATETITTAPAFKDDYVDFTKSLLNKKPYKRLYEGSTLLTEPTLSQTRETVASLETTPSVPLTIKNLQPLTARYASFTVENKGSAPITRSLDVDLSSLVPFDALDVRALLITNKMTENIYDVTVEDWTGLSQRKLCFDDPAENVDEVILILTNPHTDKASSEAKVTITRNGTACAKDTGTVQYSSSGQGQLAAADEYGVQTRTSSLDVTSKWNVVFDSYDPDSSMYYYSFTASTFYAGGASLNMTLAKHDAGQNISGSVSQNSSVGKTSHNPPLPGEDAALEEGNYAYTPTGHIEVHVAPTGTIAEYAIYFDAAIVHQSVSKMSQRHQDEDSGDPHDYCSGKFTLDVTDTYSSGSNIIRHESIDCRGVPTVTESDPAEIRPAMGMPQSVVDHLFQGTFDYSSGLITGTFTTTECALYGDGSYSERDTSDEVCSGHETMSLRVKLPTH